MADKDELVADFNNGDYVASGAVGADIVKIILGPVEPDPATFL